MKKYTQILSILTLSIVISGQELDQAFLNSLPEAIQQDIANKTKEQSSLDDPIYRSIESQTELEKKKLKDVKKRLEEDLKYLEERLSEDEYDPASKDLMLFGSVFFSTYQSTYMPINEPNLSPTYILDFGDVLDIQLIGQRDENESFQIKRVTYLFVLERLMEH